MASDGFPAAALVLSVLIWGCTFVLVKDTLAHAEAFTLVAARFAIAFLVLAPVLLWKKEKLDIGTIKDGALIGLFVFLGFAGQTLGLNYTTPSKSAFITGLFVVLVPFFMALMGKKLGRRDFVAALVAFLGLALITYRPGMSFNPGDLLTFGCAIAFALDIIFTGEFIKRRGLFPLTLAQFGTVALLGGIFAMFSGPRLEAEAIPATLFLALFATLLGLVAQAWAQKRISQITTGVILSLEPVFAAIFSYFFASETFSALGLAGSGLILSGILVASSKREKAG